MWGDNTIKEIPLAMAMYAIGILPLINQLQSTDAKQVWFADDTHGWWQPWTASWVVGGAEQPWPHIWIVCQSQQNMADHERETSVNSNTEISEYRSEHHHWLKERDTLELLLAWDPLL